MDYAKFLLFQVTDSLFPIGAYAHSYGLETYIEKGLITSADMAKEYIKSYIKNTTVYSELLVIKCAYEYAKNCDLAKLIELEQLSAVSRVALETRNASIKLGSRFVKTVLSMGVEYQSDIFSQYSSYPKIEHSLVVAFGVFCASIEVEYDEAVQKFLYSQTSALVTSCVKTIPLSQTAGQQILHELILDMQNALEKTKALSEESLFISCIGSDIRSMQHENLYSRIYMS